MIELSSNITNYLQAHFGDEYVKNYVAYYNGEYKPYLRISSTADSTALINSLRNYGIDLAPIDSVKNAYRIVSGSEFAGKTLEFILGKYYIQSLSSMIPALVLNPNENDRVLDLCAAPGSKTTQLAELINNKGTLVANEVAMDRLKSLVFNVDKMNLVNVGVMHGKGELLSKRFENYFDKILVDAPCSALGIVQKKGEVSNWWDVRKAETISDLQLRLLVAAIKMCKVGGEIVYSTCTLTLEENEFIIDKVLKKYPVELEEIKLPIQSHPGFSEIGDHEFDKQLEKTCRIVPWEVESEGFFVCKLRKTDSIASVEKILYKGNKFDLLNPSSGKIKTYLENLSNHFGIPRSKFDEYKYFLRSNDVHFVNKDWNCNQHEFFNRIGARLGTIDKRGTVSLNSLAGQVFGESASQNITRLENREELAIYFRGGTIKNKFDTTGQKIIMYAENILGTGIATNEGLKSQFPRAFRTQEIILPRT
ncbi:MAG: RsmB/NOP family class I SAM-dependent RNA methyltransferase [Bacteroidota bacterium]